MTAQPRLFIRLAVINFTIVAAMIAFVALTNGWILFSTRSEVFTRLDSAPTNSVALVLGTSPTVGHWDNPFFVGRIDAAAALYHAGKVKHLLVSGDNSRKTYDEPSAMRDALVAHGVPAKAITLDYAGFRTLDSVARAHAVFGLTHCTIVSDGFHLPRSIYLARAHGMDACGFASAPLPWKWAKKTRIREIASRVVAWIDVTVLRTKPKFYGPKVNIPTSDPA